LPTTIANSAQVHDWDAFPRECTEHWQCQSKLCTASQLCDVLNEGTTH
jgi:hypothetical protein